MDSAEKYNIIKDQNGTAVFNEEYEPALVGFVKQGNRVAALYDFYQCVQLAMRMGMTQEAAEEYIERTYITNTYGDDEPAYAFLFRYMEKEPPKINKKNKRNFLAWIRKTFVDPIRPVNPELVPA